MSSETKPAKGVGEFIMLCGQKFLKLDDQFIKIVGVARQATILSA